MHEPPPNQDVLPPERLRWLTSWLLHHASSHANRLVAAHAGRPGFRMRYALLAGLDQYGSLSQAELCRRLGVDRGDAVSALNDMERDGLARRLPDPADARRNVVEITPAGAEALFELDAVVNAAQDELLQRLTKEERGQLNVLLHKLIEPPEAR
ncbi:MarR family winged helix-turn-helix transcriptional regulator [Micromonospora sp. NPDC047670]|uniref:MarR family winged helix-turn-helix transcriptional regulator n=1 Tax=Micromonospora sp. NPDC047670 TaxID=3364252 RepID=UPI00371B48E1